MKSFRSVTSRALVLDRPDVDTDQIIPKQFLKRIERSGFGEFLFFDWRKDPAFELNQPEAEDARILITGRNFGCGSSREHAPWALEDFGFQAIVAPSFADIFYSNCTKIGLLATVLDEQHCQALARAGEGQVDLQAQEVRYSGPDGGRVAVAFEIDPEIRRRLLAGLDDTGVTLDSEALIAAYEGERERSGPVTTAL